MPSMNINVAGVWKVSRPWVNVAGTWQGAQTGWVNVAGTWQKFYQFFTASVVIHTTLGAFTETIPVGATTCVIEVWGGGSSGSAGIGTGCTADVGSTGGCGGYSRTSISVAGQSGSTFTGSVGGGGAPSRLAGTVSTCSAGTVTGFTAMTANPGAAESGTGSGHDGVGGTASGGNQVNTTGATGSQIGTTGTVSGDGSPYGGGGSSGASGAGHPGGAGHAGAIVYYYT